MAHVCVVPFESEEADMSSPSRKGISSYLAQWLLLGASLLILGGVVGWNLYAEYKAIDALERERLTTQAKVINENLGRQLVATNLALDSIRSELSFRAAQRDGKVEINRHLQAIREAMPGMRAITLFDAKGTLTARSPDQFVGQNFSDREYFQIARQGGDPTRLYVSPPFLAATGEYVINMVKVLIDERGGFAGAVLASLDPSYFSVLLNSILYASDMRVSLVHGDGKLFLQLPPLPGIEGKDLALPGTFFTRHNDSGQQISLLTGTVYATGDERMMVLHTIKPGQVPMDKPLVLSASRSLPSIFGAWRHGLYVHGGLYALLMLTSIIGLSLFQKRLHAYDLLVAKQEAEQKQTEADLRVSAAAFESQEAMMITDASSVILRVNRAFTEITGFSAEEIVGQTPRLLQSGRHNADFYRSMWDSINAKGGWRGEVWDRRKNGEEYPKWLTISAVKNNRGAVTHYIGTHYDITERKKAEDRINELAFFDQLTGLPNRTLLVDRLKQAMTASNRNGVFGALLFIDLDRFKTLNDTMGHDKGDLLLQQVAKRLNASVREGDTVARLGGDEFVVVLGGLNGNSQEAASQTEVVGEKILTALNQAYRLGDIDHLTSASIGATLFSGHETSIDDLLKQADLAMYKAKDTGRNALRFFDPAMQTVVMERAALENHLRQALVANQFLLYYQAQVVGDGRVTGAEVLVRWNHPERGMVSPADFIPLAEETGLILPLGQWILAAACKQLAHWATRPEMALLTVAVNVSAHQFRQPDFVDQVLAVLESTGADPKQLKLELTESMLVSNLEDIVEKMFALRAKGVGFSLDDFGTGFSSLSYLKRLPLDQLKIDQSFVRDVLSDPNDAAIAKTIITLAQSLGLGVIAEGVETRMQQEFLASSGCHAYQGYFFSRPLPVDGFEAFSQRAAMGEFMRHSPAAFVTASRQQLAVAQQPRQTSA
jgi:diguanylate cyclase (GGDEF)-like protein/PAS domain S-box-containing protein